MKKIILLVFLPVVFILPQRNYNPVSFFCLISDPGFYNGKNITVSGYLHSKFEDCAIYFSKDDADYLIGENAIWVNPDASTVYEDLKGDKNHRLDDFDSKYVIISGTFNSKDFGHMGAYAGTITISSLRERRQWYDGKTELWEDKIDGKGLQPKKN